ncbi:MAG: DUF4124 domain-containing protein [Thermodesulfobacteriota bacterium]
MKIKSALVAALFLCASTASADLYLWKDRDGVSHITDSMKTVPQEYRPRVKVYESAPVPERPAPQAEEQRPLVDTREPSYGGRTEEWWRQAFRVRRQQIEELASSIDNKERFVGVFEAGRRFGQIFDKENVDTYKRYKETLPTDMEKLVELEAELKKLRKEAAIEDVPREIWRDKK